MGTAKFLGKDRKCFHIGDSPRGLREICTVVDEEVREIQDYKIYLVEKEGGRVEGVSGSALVPQR